MMSYTESTDGGHTIFRLNAKDYKRGLCGTNVLKVDYASPNYPSDAVGAHDPRNGVQLSVKSTVAQSYFVFRYPSPRTVRCEYVSDTKGFFSASDGNTAQFVISSMGRLQDRLKRKPELLNIVCIPELDCEALIRDFKFKNGVYVDRIFESGAHWVSVSYRAKGTWHEQSSGSFQISFKDFGDSSKEQVKVTILPLPMPPD